MPPSIGFPAWSHSYSLETEKWAGNCVGEAERSHNGLWRIRAWCARHSKKGLVSPELKNRVSDGPRRSLGQHGRFWEPTWIPKWKQNRHFFGSKSQVILRSPKKPKFHSRLSGAHILSFPGGAKTLQKSIENRSQEPSMLSLFFDTSKIASRALPGRLLEKKLT